MGEERSPQSTRKRMHMETYSQCPNNGDDRLCVGETWAGTPGHAAQWNLHSNGKAAHRAHHGDGRHRRDTKWEKPTRERTRVGLHGYEVRVQQSNGDEVRHVTGGGEGRRLGRRTDPRCWGPATHKQ